MVGYAGWTMERTLISDETIPILADGIKWIGYAPETHLLWNLGAFTDTLSEGQTFSTYSSQFVGRIAWLPIENDTPSSHLGADTRYGKPDDGMLQLRSRPEYFEAPFFIDTGNFQPKVPRRLHLRPTTVLDRSSSGANISCRRSILRRKESVLQRWERRHDLAPPPARYGRTNRERILRPDLSIAAGFSGRTRIGGTRRQLFVRQLEQRTHQGGKFWRFTPMVTGFSRTTSGSSSLMATVR